MHLTEWRPPNVKTTKTSWRWLRSWHWEEGLEEAGTRGRKRFTVTSGEPRWVSKHVASQTLCTDRDSRVRSVNYLKARSPCDLMSLDDDRHVEVATMWVSPNVERWFVLMFQRLSVGTWSSQNPSASGRASTACLWYSSALARTLPASDTLVGLNIRHQGPQSRSDKRRANSGNGVLPRVTSVIAPDTSCPRLYHEATLGHSRFSETVVTSRLSQHRRATFFKVVHNSRTCVVACFFFSRIDSITVYCPVVMLPTQWVVTEATMSCQPTPVFV